MRTGTRGLTALAVAAATLVATAAPAAAGTPAGSPVGVTVDSRTELARIAPAAVGVNTPIWNPYLLDSAVPGLIRQAGIGLLEFNGGPISDRYHWRDASVSPDPDPDGHADLSGLPAPYTFDQFESVVRETGTQALVHVNYGTGTPAEAAGWVRYANVVKHYGVKEWAVGEEVWGNGSIDGVNFEPDGHADKSPQAYANAVLRYARAMKAVDPSIKVGVELTGLEWWELGDWDRAVMSIVGSTVDFVDFHYYPFTATDTSNAGLLKLPRDTPAEVAAIRSLVDANSNGHHVDLVAGETNSAVTMQPQQISTFNALYLADDVLSLLESGTRQVAWWALHNGGYGSTSGDLGLLSSGDCDDAGTVCPPPVDTPFPPYYGMRLVGAMAQAGGTLLRVSTGDPLVVGHAVREPDGTLAVLLLNENPTSPVTVTVNQSGRRLVSETRYADGDSGVRPAHGYTLPAYSLTLFQYR